MESVLPSPPRLYYLSDTHHELMKDRVSQQINVKIDEDYAGKRYLALCGDIGSPFQSNYESFIRRHAERFDHVFIVTGNHEYYTSKSKQRTIAETDARTKEIADGLANVSFLQCDSVMVDDILFVGCTLWSKVSGEAEYLMNDYRRIFVNNGINEDRLTYETQGTRRKRIYLRAGKSRLKASEVHESHLKMRAYLKETLRTTKAEKVVVLTHHAPTMEMLSPLTPSLAANPIEMMTRTCYASDCDDLFVPPVVCWVSGHTHRCVDDVKINGIPSVSNCMGYRGEKTGVCMEKYIEI
jgi:predicted phosphodiesterase